jgi:uncharacterized membrane protein YbhN (UPF0104 family)
MTTFRTKVLVSATAFLALAILVASPPLLRGHVLSAFASLAAASPHWLAVAALGFVLAFVCTVGAWRAAFAAAGARICPRQAAARLGIGSLVNAFAPAKLGDAVKVALCSKALDAPDRLWTAGGVYAALAAARSLALASLLVVASATGALPLWPVFALCGVVAGIALAALSSRRWRAHPRIASLLDGIVALERSPRAAATVLAWSLGVQLARLLGTMAVARGLGLPHPVLAALVIMPALDLASVFPLTPGGIGIGSGAVAVALASRGIGMTQALGAGFAIQALETVVSIAVGTAGAVYLTRLNVDVRRWAVRLSAVGASAALAAALGFLVLDLV